MKYDWHTKSYIHSCIQVDDFKGKYTPQSSSISWSITFKNFHMTEQSHYWAYILRKPGLKKTHVPQCSLQHSLQQRGDGRNLWCQLADEWITKLWCILLSYKKEHIWVCSKVDEVAELRVYHTEWNKSEIERQISYINTYIWNLER